MNVDAMIAQLVKMTPEQRQQFAQEHMDDPISLSAAKYVDNQIKDQAQKMVQPQGPMPPVNQQIARSIGQTAPPTQPLMTPAPTPQQQPMQAQMQAQMQPQQTAIAQQAQEAAKGGAMYSLPENSGIANLPTKMNFADGGIVGYAGGGSSEYDPSNIQQAVYKSYAAQQAQQYGLNPDFALGIFNQENPNWDPSRLGPVTKYGDRAIGLGQVMPNTGKGMGYSVSDLKDPFKNMDASIQTMAQISKKYNGDPTKTAAAYNWGPGNLDKHLSNNDNKVVVDKLPNETQNYLANVLTNLAPGSTAHAATLPAAKAAAPVLSSAPAVNRTGMAASSDPSNDMSYLESEGMSPAMQQRRLLSAPKGVSRVSALASLGGNETILNPGERIVNGMVVDRIGIPIRSATVSGGMSPTAPDSRSIFEKGADYFGISEDTQRNISNALNALAGPELGAALYASKAVKGLPALVEGAPAEVNAVAAAAAAKRARDLEAAGTVARGEMAASDALNAPTWAARANARAGANMATGRGAGGIYELTQEAQTARKVAQDAARARAVAEEGTVGVQGGANAARAADEAAAAARMADEAAATTSNASKESNIANAARAASTVDAAANTLARNYPSLSTEATPAAAEFTPFDYDERGGAANAPSKEVTQGGGLPQILSRNPYEIARNADEAEQQGPPISAMNRDKDSSPNISAQPTKDASMLSSDDWLALAAGLLSNKSQYASEAFGAGLGSLVQGRAARKAAESQQALQAAQAKEAVGKGGYYDQLSSTVGPEAAAKIAYQGSETARLNLLNQAFPQKNAAELRQIDANIQRELQSANYINQQAQYFGPEATSKINLQNAAAALDISRKNMFEGKNDVQSIREMIDALKPIAHSMPDPLIPESSRQIMEAKNHLQYYSEQLAKKTGIGVPDNAIPGFVVH